MGREAGNYLLVQEGYRCDDNTRCIGSNGNRTLRPLDISPTNHFAYETLRLSDKNGVKLKCYFDAYVYDVFREALCKPSYRLEQSPFAVVHYCLQFCGLLRTPHEGHIQQRRPLKVCWAQVNAGCVTSLPEVIWEQGRVAARLPGGGLSARLEDT